VTIIDTLPLEVAHRVFDYDSRVPLPVGLYTHVPNFSEIGQRIAALLMI